MSLPRVLRAAVLLALKRPGDISVNALYINRQQGGRTLSTEGRTFQRRVVLELATRWITESVGFDVNGAYRLELDFYLPAVINAAWPKCKGRFKRIDVTNLAKFIQDCVVSATGIDDANHVQVHITKQEDPERPRVEICLQTLDAWQSSCTA